MPNRRFPPPWRAEKMPGGYVVRDANGQALVYLYSRDNEAEAMQASRLDQPWTGRRRCLAILSLFAADEWSSLSSAHRTHLAANRSHVALLSGDRVNLAMARHSPANFLNSSDGFTLVILPVSDKSSLSNARPRSTGSLARG
jgi:hypothetical protein